jgi:ribosomal protein RSM22 (predicted rRNA methylase)
MNALQQAIIELVDHFDLQKLKKASAALSSCYKGGGTLTREEELLAYLIVRLPATYAVLCRVLSQVPMGSLLDLGAGPGTSWWAARSLWSQLPPITAIEREAIFIELGKKMGVEAAWIQGNLLSFEAFEAHDWVLFSYSLTEIAENEIPLLLKTSWQAAKKGLIIVEPGTPASFRRLISARNLLISWGASILAPCPHVQPCPLKSDDWCHFSVRLERSFLHRYAKEADLPFEDEKFSYLIVTKEPQPAPQARILRHPERRSGHVVLPLCSSNGLQNATISRRHKEVYKKARKAEWGDSWPPKS